MINAERLTRLTLHLKQHQLSLMTLSESASLDEGLRGLEVHTKLRYLATEVNELIEEINRQLEAGKEGGTR